MVLTKVAPLGQAPKPLQLVDLETPVPGDDEVLLRITACGVCHTELDEIEGRLTPSFLPIVLGHESDQAELLKLSYHQHLWMEREIKSVANLTHSDISEFLPLAAAIGLAPEVTTYQLEQANEALRNLRDGKIKGVNVLVINK